MPESDGPENLKILKKRQLGVDCGPCRQTIELLPLGQRMEFSAIELSFLPFATAVKFFGSRLAKINWEQTPRNVPNVGGVVSIVWLRKTFKNFISLLVSKNWSQKLINGSYLNNGVTCVFDYIWFSICICIAIQHKERIKIYFLK